MGAYINPTGGKTKEQWLTENATKVPEGASLKFESVPKGQLPVVLVDNGFFTAADIAFSARELEAFTGPDDGRPKEFYLAKVDDLLKVSDLKHYLGS